jgi:hypothetical protein
MSPMAPNCTVSDSGTGHDQRIRSMQWPIRIDAVAHTVRGQRSAYQAHHRLGQEPNAMGFRCLTGCG